MSSIEEKEKRERLIYDLIANQFRLEWQRINALDEKANSIIMLAGIIIVLEASLGGFLLKEIRTFECYALLCSLFLLSIILLMCSILSGLKACYVKTWTIVPEPEPLIEDYTKEDTEEEIKKERVCLLMDVSKEIATSIKENGEKMAKKAKFIKVGHVFLALGIGMIVVVTIAQLI